MSAVIVVIFGLTYVLIAGRRLELLPIGRPAGALLGAMLMVLVGALTPTECYAAIDHDTILLLFAMMLLTSYLDRAGFFEAMAVLLLRCCRTPRALLSAVAVASAALSAVLVNDTVCVFFTPLVVVLCRRAGLPLGPYLIALATSANIGSAATLVGNPQNMIIGTMSRFGFLEFLLRAGPATVAGLAINVGLLHLYYRRKLPDKELVPGPLPANLDRRRLALAAAVLAGMVACFLGGLHMGFTSLGGVLVLVLAERRDPAEAFSRVDWPLLVFFCSLFIVVAGLGKTGLIERTWAASAPWLALQQPGGLALFSGLMVLGSNLVSNVPMVLLTGPHLGELGAGGQGWVLLAYTTTIAGNFTLIGSVANIIVAERARPHYRLGFREYLRFGLVSTVLVLAVGVALIALQHRWLGL